MVEPTAMGVAAAAVAVAGWLARILWEQMRPRRADPPEGDTTRGRWDVGEIRSVKEDVKVTRAVVESMRELLQAQVTKMAVLEYRVDELFRRVDELHPRE